MRITESRLRRIVRSVILENESTRQTILDIAKTSFNNAVKKIGDITKKVLKRLYKDLSLQHPYIIDRIKV